MGNTDSTTDFTTALRVALVTGGAQRIGAALCRALHGAGYKIALHYQSSGEAAATLAEELNRVRDGSAACFQAMLGERSAAEELVGGVLDRFGRVDLLVNNASAFYPTPIGSITEEDWDTLVGSNLKGPLFLCQAMAVHLAQSGGSIINMIDIHGERPLADYAVYSTAKAGLAMLTRSLARELAPEVRVNGIAPGAILWPVSDDAEDAERRERQLLRVPLGRKGEPGDIAETVLFLADRAPFITGQIIAVDGGRSLT
jgi:pteridine reductase